MKPLTVIHVTTSYESDETGGITVVTGGSAGRLLTSGFLPGRITFPRTTQE